MGQRISVLRDGRIVQNGTPGDLYKTPDDAFVAGLVGSPKMNMVEGEIAGDGGGVRLPFLDIDGGPWSESLRGFRRDTSILFGVRPQDLRPLNGAAVGPSFDAEVHLTEPLGDITVLDLIAKDVPLRMVLPEEQALAYRVGDRVELTVRLENCHLFALDTGTAIR
jgi:multiple sugar transport system ATP-binding protein